MQEVNKAYIYKCLNELQSSGIDVTKYLSMMVGASEIPYEIVVFINRHRPIEKLTTYNEIYNKRRNSPLFRNLVKTNLPHAEKAIVLSSLLTQSLIGVKHYNEKDKSSVIDSINVELIMQSLYDYIYNNNTQIIDQTFETFQTIFRTLFPKK